MNKVGYIFHKDYLKHTSLDYHPENSQRLKAIEKAVDESGLKNDMELIHPDPATEDDILLNHTGEHFNLIKATSAHDYGNIDPDTYYCRDSFDAAMLAAGGAIKAGKMVMEGKINSAFCAVRPPGHHAEPGRAMGFCLFNNIAILAHWLIKEYKLTRIAILDWDGHHGNGTQRSFYDTKKVHYCSLHQYPWYPGTGSAVEQGSGEGKGYNLNFPMRAGSGDDEFVNAIKQGWVTAMQKYRPEIILISAGYDAYIEDPYVYLSVTAEGFDAIFRDTKKVADEHCDGRIISILEGGYIYDFLGKAVVEHIKILME